MEKLLTYSFLLSNLVIILFYIKSESLSQFVLSIGYSTSLFKYIIKWTVDLDLIAVVYL